MSTDEQSETQPVEEYVFTRTTLQQLIEIHNLITFHYFEFSKDYEFTGERHNFWEFLYVDRGTVNVTVDHTTHTLAQGEIIFHKPNEYHSFCALQGKAPNLIVMTFDCHSDAMKHFEDQVISLANEERNLLAMIVDEGRQAFKIPCGHPIIRQANAPIGGEQLIKCYLEAFLIRLLRKHLIAQPAAPKTLSSAARENISDDLVKQITLYLEEHLADMHSLESLSQRFLISKTRLKDLFKQQTGYTVMEYMMHLRMEHAKMIMREETANMTEIATRLGFSSVHYFSKSFKKKTRMSPTEYARTVKARIRN